MSLSSDDLFLHSGPNVRQGPADFRELDSCYSQLHRRDGPVCTYLENGISSSYSVLTFYPIRFLGSLPFLVGSTIGKGRKW